MRGEATVLHADLDAFYASVEQRDEPSLRGRPLIVGGGVVAAASHQAKARGVRTAMATSKARALCPEAIVVPPRMEAYSEASRAVFAIFHDTTPHVEGMSIDEAFLEVGGLLAWRALRSRSPCGSGSACVRRWGSRSQWATRTPSSSRRWRARSASPTGSSSWNPTARRRSSTTSRRAAVGRGRVTAEKLHTRGIHTVGQLAELEAETAQLFLGRRPVRACTPSRAS